MAVATVALAAPALTIGSAPTATIGAVTAVAMEALAAVATRFTIRAEPALAPGAPLGTLVRERDTFRAPPVRFCTIR